MIIDQLANAGQYYGLGARIESAGKAEPTFT